MAINITLFTLDISASSPCVDCIILFFPISARSFNPSPVQLHNAWGGKCLLGAWWQTVLGTRWQQPAAGPQVTRMHPWHFHLGAAAAMLRGGRSARGAGAVSLMQLLSDAQRSLEVPYFWKQRFQINALPIPKVFW